jgi:hypothetical protein
VEAECVLIDRNNWGLHRGWVLGTGGAFGVATGWYLAERFSAGFWPGGSSRSGFLFGVVGGLIVLFEMFLWVRKRWLRVWRIGRTQVWLRAHIWLGLLCLPLLIYHSGFRLGGTLSTVLLIFLLIVIVSGVWGLVMQQFLPTRLLERVPGETIYSQIERVSGQLRLEAARLVGGVCGLGGEAPLASAVETNYATEANFQVVGAVRTAGRVQGMVLETRNPVDPVPDAEILGTFFQTTIEPFLLKGAASGLALQSPQKAGARFRDLRTQLPSAAHRVVDILESLCDQRRQLDAQARIQFWLHNWLWIHLPLSAALVVLMILHVWMALKYW